MEEEDNIIVKWAQEDVETSYNLLHNNNNNIYIYVCVCVCVCVCDLLTPSGMCHLKNTSLGMSSLYRPDPQSAAT